MWRIISHNQDGSIKIISNDKTASLAFDEKGNTIFNSSSLNNYLNNQFYNNLKNIEIKKSDFCLNYNQNKCIKTVNITVGLLTIEDYQNASNNLNCQNDNKISCKESNYLSKFSINNGPEYTLNTTNENIYIIKDGIIDTINPKEKLNIRPVITITNTSKIIGGSGTKENPYIIDEVWKLAQNIV